MTVPRAEAYWVGTAPATAFPALAGDLAVDVAIVGGGIVGLTAAAILKSAGLSVAVLEARQTGRQATGHSTGKVTAQHAVIYAGLVRSHGRRGAEIYAEANQAGVERVAAFVRDLRIDCDFERKPAYVHTVSPERVAELEEETECARSLGLPAELLREAPGPFGARAAVRFANQAQFHPCKYLAGLARHVDGGGSHVFENTRATDVESGPPARVATQNGSLTAREVIVATQMPVTNKGMYFAKAYPQSEAMLAAPVEPAKAPEGMFISIDTPTLSVVAAPNGGRPYLIAAGGSYKPGHTEEADAAFATLERTVRDLFGVGEIAYRWTNHDYWPMDGVPFVGRPGEHQSFVATGFRAWGLSNGTAAGMMIADAIAGRANPWAELFDARRAKPMVSSPSFIVENTKVAGELIGGYLARRAASPAALQAGEAGVFKADGETVAAYRDPAGALHEVSAVCTHMKCVVGWNPTELTWDCPCHGSRFTIEGDVIRGPAVAPLSRKGPR